MISCDHHSRNIPMLAPEHNFFTWRHILFEANKCGAVARFCLRCHPYLSRERKNENLLHVVTILPHRGISCGRMVATISAAFRYIFLFAARVFSTEGLGYAFLCPEFPWVLLNLNRLFELAPRGPRYPPDRHFASERNFGGKSSWCYEKLCRGIRVAFMAWI